jgi:hypothetical protein
MHVDRFCSMDLKYTDFHMARPYGNESGLGWGGGDGTVAGEQLSGGAQWSNQPRRRGDGVMLPNGLSLAFRFGVVTDFCGVSV